MFYNTKLSNVYEKIWQSPLLLADYLLGFKTTFNKFNGRNPSICMVSGGFDVPHYGHFRYIREAANTGDFLVVVVNGGGFLKRKKGYEIMPIGERMEMIAHLEGVGAVLTWDDGTQFVDGAIKLIRPDKFLKGGDRSDVDSLAIEELQACKEINCEIVLGVGGSSKIQSSSWLANTMLNGVNIQAHLSK